MGRHFDAAYNHAMEKLAAFDIDDSEDQRLYNKIKDDPRTDEWLRGTHNDLKSNRNILRNLAIGSGAVGLGSGILAAASKSARPVAVPVAIAGGALGLTSGLGALGAHGELQAYDKGYEGARRRQNIDRYMTNHGSMYAGRRAQREAERDRSANALNALLLASALSDR